MTTVPFTPPVYTHPSMTPETRDAVTRLAGMDGAPHFVLTWFYDITKSAEPSGVLDIKVQAWDTKNALRSYTLEQAADMYGAKTLGEARVCIEIDRHIRRLIFWLEATQHSPFGTSNNIAMQICPGVIRLYHTGPELLVHAILSKFQNTEMNCEVPILSSFFLPENTSAHDRLENLSLLATYQHYWQDDFNAIEDRTGPFNRRFKFDTYKVIP